MSDSDMMLRVARVISNAYAVHTGKLGVDEYLTLLRAEASEIDGGWERLASGLASFSIAAVDVYRRLAEDPPSFDEALGNLRAAFAQVEDDT